MRFIVDAQLPPALAGWLRDKGHDAVALRDIGLRDADDREIWAKAAANQEVIITKDEDFTMLASVRETGPKILWVRTGNLVNRLLLARFEQAWPDDEVVEYALRRTLSPALVAQYRTQLPDKEMLRAKLAEFYRLSVMGGDSA